MKLTVMWGSCMSLLFQYGLDVKKERFKIKSSNKLKYSNIMFMDYFNIGLDIDKYKILEDVNLIDNYRRINYKKGFNYSSNLGNVETLGFNNLINECDSNLLFFHEIYMKLHICQLNNGMLNVIIC